MEANSEQSIKAPAISVIIPGYNVREYLERCLDSILAQNFTDYEVIFVNDGSKDATLEIFQRYLPRFARATLIDQENKGLSGARNAGIQAATGDYINFIDSDDWVAPTMLQSLFDAITDTQSDIAQVDYVPVSSSNDIPPQPTPETQRVLNTQEALYEMFEREKYSACIRLYRRSVIEGDDEVFPTGLTSEDRVANFKLIARAQRVVVSNRIEYYYYLNYGSISYSGLDRRGFDLLEADARIVGMAQEYGDARVLKIVEDRAAKGSFSLLIRWARFGVIDPSLGEDDVKSLRARYRKDYPRLMSSPLSLPRKLVAWQLRYMPGILKAEFKLHDTLTGQRKRH